MHAHPPKGADLLEKVVSLATTDLAFRTRLLNDPAGAVQERFGLHIPAGFRVRFIEKPADVDALIVLPDPVREDGELDEDDLDMVAGGTDSCINTAPW